MRMNRRCTKMWLNIYQYYYLIYLKQLKYKNFSLINVQKNWFFFNTLKKNLRIFLLFKLILVTHEIIFFKKGAAKFLTTNASFVLFRFYIFLIPSNIRQVIDPHSTFQNQFCGLQLNTFFQVNALSKLLFFLTTFKKLQVFWIFRKALLVK